VREYLLVFLVALTTTYLLTVIAREIAIRTGAFAVVRDRDVHDVPVPYLGGLAMMGGLVAAYLLAFQLPFLSQIEPYFQGQARAVLIAGMIICAVGVLDDIFELDALTKFGGQLLAGGYLVTHQVQYSWITWEGRQISLDPTQGAIFTVFIVIATVNAVNFVDGLDGLAAGVVGIGASAFFLVCYQLTVINSVQRATAGALLAAALAGACAGFLPHNFHPARVFMGDSGSMLIGLFLSASSITLTGRFTQSELPEGTLTGASGFAAAFLPVALPLLILIVPFADLLLAVIRRTRAGRSPFSPDKQHLHHRMLEIGHSHRRAVIIMWLWAALIGFGTALASLYSGELVWALIAAGVVFTVAATFLLPVVQAPKLPH